MDRIRQRDQRDQKFCHVLRLQNAIFVLLCNRRRPLFQQRRVDFAGIDVREPDAILSDLIGNARPQRGHRELAGRIGDAAQGEGSFASDGRDVDDVA